MSPREQRIAIAEARSWKHQPETDVHYLTPAGNVVPETWAHEDKDGLELACEQGLPNYLYDLNAMHEAESSLNNNQKWDYLAHLHKIMETYHTAELIFATAAQRAEAFLKTIGKWKD